MNDIKFLNAFNSIPGVGPATLGLLKNHFGNFETAWLTGEEELKRAGVRAQEIQAILWKRPSLHPDREMEKLIKNGITAITEGDAHYPALLREISGPPPILYLRGNPQTLSASLPLGIVGTRRPTHYGLEVTAKLATELANAGFTIVSGLATGIDARSHEAALEAGGKTIAVLGSGVDHPSIFPPENRGLARRIIESGNALISEFAPGTPAMKEHFPMRNRIISGISKGVLVVEAREKSGALITARLALEQNRDVFAVPGSIFTPTSHGPNKLIQQGAKLVEKLEDILEEFGMEYNKSTVDKVTGALDEKETLLLEFLVEPIGVDFLKEKTGLETSAIIASLSMLELKGHIKSLGGDTYQKIS